MEAMNYSELPEYQNIPAGSAYPGFHITGATTLIKVRHRYYVSTPDGTKRAKDGVIVSGDEYTVSDAVQTARDRWNGKGVVEMQIFVNYFPKTLTEAQSDAGFKGYSSDWITLATDGSQHMLSFPSV
jgi:hypothetical protein